MHMEFRITGDRRSEMSKFFVNDGENSWDSELCLIRGDGGYMGDFALRLVAEMFIVHVKVHIFSIFHFSRLLLFRRCSSALKVY